MIRIHFVGDGPRDAATIPELVRTILGAEIQRTGHAVTNWFHLRDKGYQKKVLFALLQARDLNASALVAVVDRDKAPKGERLQKLREGRDEHRSKLTPIPAALGEANPHGEAWPLDDETAVREALELDTKTQVPSVGKVRNPKSAVEALIAASGHRNDPKNDVLAAIAKLVQPVRCAHMDQTGFEDFMKEVHDELGALKSRAVDSRDSSWP
jgi:hypothetical protein